MAPRGGRVRSANKLTGGWSLRNTGKQENRPARHPACFVLHQRWLSPQMRPWGGWAEASWLLSRPCETLATPEGSEETEPEQHRQQRAHRRPRAPGGEGGPCNGAPPAVPAPHRQGALCAPPRTTSPGMQRGAAVHAPTACPHRPARRRGRDPHPAARLLTPQARRCTRRSATLFVVALPVTLPSSLVAGGFEAGRRGRKRQLP